MMGVRRGVAVVVALAAVGAGLTGAPGAVAGTPAAAAPKAARAKATLLVAPSTVVPGEAVVLSGRSKPRVKRALTVQQQVGKRWKTVATGRTNKRGAFRVVHVPRLTDTGRAALRVRLAPVRKRGLAALTTRVRRVSATAQSADLTLPATSFVNKVVPLSGRFTPARPGRPVVLQQRTPAGWSDLATLAQDASGTVSSQLGAATAGSFDYRLTAIGQAGAPAISSAPRTLTVQADPVVVTSRLEALTTAESAALAFDPATGTLSFGPGAPPSVADIAVGDFVAVPPRARLGSGALVEVTSVSAGSLGTTMTSTPASLPEVVEDVPDGAGDVAMPVLGAPSVTEVGDGVTVTVRPAPGPGRTAPARAGGASASTGLVSLDGPEVAAEVDVTLETTQGDASAKAELTGSVAVTPTVEMALDVDWFEVKSYRVGAGLKVRDSLELSAQMEVEKEWTKKLFTVSVVRGGFIGPVPVWVELTGTVNAKVSADGSVDASITWSRDGASIVGVRGDASDGLTPHAYQQTATARSSVARATAAGSLHGEVYGSVSLELYSLVGPFVDLGYQGDATITGDTETGIACEVSHGPLARIGLSTPDLLKKLIDKTVGPIEKSFDLPQTTVVACPAGTSVGRPSIATTTMPPAQLDEWYEFRLTTADDRAGTWRVASGQLPGGLTLDPVSGVVSGTATGFEEVARFAVGFVDAAGTQAPEVLLSIEVTSAPVDGGSDGTPWLWTLVEMEREGVAYRDQNNAYHLQQDYTLRTDVPGHYFHTALVVPEGVTLTIPAATRIKVGHCYWTVHLPPGPCLNVRGHVEMGGDASRPVIVTAYRDDSVGGDTDGVPPEQNYASSAPMTVMDGGTLDARGVDLRWTGFTLTGTGASTFSDVRLRQGSILQAIGSGPVTITRLHQMSGAGAVQLHNGAHTATASRFGAEAYRGLTIGGAARVTDSTVVGGTVHVQGADNVFARNSLGSTVYLEASTDGAGADYSGTRLAGGTRPRLNVAQETLYRDVTWSPDVVHTLSGKVRVPAGLSLTLPPGATVAGLAQVGYFGASGGLIVEGRLVAAGTSVAPVTMTNAADPSLELVDTSGYGYAWGGPAVWAGGSMELTHTRVAGLGEETRFEPGSAATLRHVQWESQSSLAAQSPDVLLEDSVVRARELLMFAGALRRTTLSDTPLQVQGADVLLEDVEARGAASALRASPDGAGAGWDGVRATQGAVRHVRVVSGDLTRDVTWPAGTTFVTDGRIGVPVGTTLTLAPGALVKGQSTGGWSPRGTSFVVDGTMRALGTAGAPVVLTHLSDPTGGETPVESWMNGAVWQGITAQGTGRLDLRWTEIRGAQRAVGATDPATSVTLDHVDVRDGRDQGSLLESASNELTVRDSTFSSPTERVAVGVGGVAVLERNRFERVGVASGATSLRLTHNAFLDVQGPRLQYYGEALADARSNWWGHAGTPVVATTWATGTDVVGNVDVAAWCLDAGCTSTSP